VACAEKVRDVPGAAAAWLAAATTDGDGLTWTEAESVADAIVESVTVQVTVIAPADW